MVEECLIHWPWPPGAFFCEIKLNGSLMPDSLPSLAMRSSAYASHFVKELCSMGGQCIEGDKGWVMDENLLSHFLIIE